MPLAPKRGGPSRGGGGSNTRFTGRRGGPSRGRGGRGGGGGGGGVAYGIDRPAPTREDDGTAAAEKFEEVKAWDEIDEKLGFHRFESNRAGGEEQVGWLVNMHQVSHGDHIAHRRNRANRFRHCFNPVRARGVSQPSISTSFRTTVARSKQR